MTHFNPAAPTWRVLQEHLKQQRGILMEDLLTADSHDKSQVLRGRIHQIDELLDLPNRIDEWEPKLDLPV